MYITSLILGILSLIFCWVPFLNLLLSIAALIVSIVAVTRKTDSKSNKGMSIAGTILSSIAIILSVIIWIAIMRIFNSVPGIVKKAVPKIKEEITTSEISEEIGAEAMLITKYIQVTLTNKENEYTGYINVETEKYTEKENGIEIEVFYERYLESKGFDCNVNVNSIGEPNIEK